MTILVLITLIYCAAVILAIAFLTPGADYQVRHARREHDRQPPEPPTVA